VYGTFYACETLADIDRALRRDGVHAFEEVANWSASASSAP
jgi:phosphohistidine phosphatase SixA